jgi:hypothetical protein
MDTKLRRTSTEVSLGAGLVDDWELRASSEEAQEERRLNLLRGALEQIQVLRCADSGSAAAFLPLDVAVAVAVAVGLATPDSPLMPLRRQLVRPGSTQLHAAWTGANGGLEALLAAAWQRLPQCL